MNNDLVQQQNALPVENSTPGQLVDALHTAFGNHHSRAVHAKGIIVEGFFTPDPQAAELTTAIHLQKESSKVILRFSDFTGIPQIPDNAAAANPRGIALKFILPDGTSTDIVGHSFNGFPTATSDQFRELLLAIGASNATASHPTELDRFLDSHPVAKTFLTTQKTPASYATINYFGVNAFRFTNQEGRTQFVRYQFIPQDGEQILNQDEVDASGTDYLIEEIKSRIGNKPFRFNMYAQLAIPEDKIDDPSIAWPDNREKILLGIIEINKLAANTSDQDRSLSFNPGNLPAGIETADPMLDFRAKAYPVSVKERQ